MNKKLKGQIALPFVVLGMFIITIVILAILSSSKVTKVFSKNEIKVISYFDVLDNPLYVFLNDEACGSMINNNKNNLGMLITKDNDIEKCFIYFFDKEIGNEKTKEGIYISSSFLYYNNKLIASYRIGNKITQDNKITLTNEEIKCKKTITKQYLSYNNKDKIRMVVNYCIV